MADRPVDIHDCHNPQRNQRPCGCVLHCFILPLSLFLINTFLNLKNAHSLGAIECRGLFRPHRIAMPVGVGSLVETWTHAPIQTRLVYITLLASSLLVLKYFVFVTQTNALL